MSENPYARNGPLIEPEIDKTTFPSGADTTPYTRNEPLIEVDLKKTQWVPGGENLRHYTNDGTPFDLM